MRYGKNLGLSVGLFLVTLFLLTMTPVYGQGLLVHIEPGDSIRLPRPIIIWPRPIPHPQPTPPPSTYKIKELSIQAAISDQVARVQVSQTFVNTGSRQMEVCFVFPLPYNGAIDRLTLMVDGKELEAKLYPKDEARRIYEAIVRKNQDPALMEWIGTGMFKTSVFPVPAGASRTVSLRYSQLCRKSDGLTDFLFPLSTAKYTSKPVEKIDFRLAIDSTDPIKNLYSPSHAVNIQRPDERHAVVTYSAKDTIPTADFRLFYDSGKGKVGAKVISYRPDKEKDGYFLLLASPQIKATKDERPKKTVIFVVDRSGSMSGKKIEQARGALKFVLNNLHEGDLFNVVAYDSEVESFRPELQRYDEKSRSAALGFVDVLYAGGSTNIDGALRAALSQVTDASRPTYILFLTDGLPTVGETNEMKIVDSAKKANRTGARIFSFGVGYDVNSRLLDKLTVASRGQSEYVKPDEDIEDRVSRLYKKIGSPVMTDVVLQIVVDGKIPENGSVVNRVYPSDSFDLFAGEQLVVAGRYKQSGAAKVIIAGKVGEQEVSFDFPATLVKHSPDGSEAFVAKLWAVRRIGEIIDELDLKGKNDELIKELVGLSTQYGILTPYTSFLADETNALHDVAGNTRRARQLLADFDDSSGGQAFAGRAAKGAYKRADRASVAREATRSYANTLRQAAPVASGAGGLGGRMPTADATGPRGATVTTVGGKSFYQRDGTWVDAAVTDVKLKNAVKVDRYSKTFFALVDKHGEVVAKYLAIDGKVVVELDGTVYTF